jgi:hypothetical protein
MSSRSTVYDVTTQSLILSMSSLVHSPMQKCLRMCPIQDSHWIDACHHDQGPINTPGGIVWRAKSAIVTKCPCWRRARGRQMFSVAFYVYASVAMGVDPQSISPPGVILLIAGPSPGGPTVHSTPGSHSSHSRPLTIRDFCWVVYFYR